MTRDDRGAADPPLRISYLLSQFPVATQVFAVSDIVALRAQGHRVTVHTIKPRPRDEANLLRRCGVPADLPILRATGSGAWRWPLLLWRARKQAALLGRRILAASRSNPLTALTALLCIPRALEIVEEVRKNESDVVHLFWARHAAMVLHAMGSDAATVRSAFVGAYDLVADDFLVDLGLGAAEVIFSHAEANRRYAEAKAPSGVPVNIVHRGIPLAPLGDETLRDRHSWVTASALVESKNVEAVLRAFAEACRAQPALTLHIFGDGPDRQRLAAISEQLGCDGAVRFHGHVTRDELFVQMQHAALFILLSKKPSERLPNVVKEALWAGCAVISSRSEGIEELLPDSSYGFVVDADDPQAIAAAVSAVRAETEAEAEGRRSKARALVRERFSSSRSMEHYVAAWRKAKESRDAQPSVEAGPENVVAAPLTDLRQACE